MVSGIMAAPPAAISTTIVSPITRLIPNITAVEIPEAAPGIVILVKSFPVGGAHG